MRARVASRSSGRTLPRVTPAARNWSIRLRPTSTRLLDTSRTEVGCPDCAATWAIPDPMSPHPSTPTFLIGITPPPGPRGPLSTLTVCFRRRFQQDRDPLAATDAGAGDAVAPPAPAELEEERQDQARPRGAERVAEGDRPAVHVDPLAIEPQLLLDRQVLRRERLVDLEQVDLAQGQTGALQDEADGRHGADPHDARRHARGAVSDHAPQDRPRVAPGRCGRGEHQ